MNNSLLVEPITEPKKNKMYWEVAVMNQEGSEIGSIWHAKFIMSGRHPSGRVKK